MVTISYEILIVITIVVTYVLTRVVYRSGYKDKTIKGLQNYAITIANDSIKDTIQHLEEIQKVNNEWKYRVRNLLLQLYLNPEIIKHIRKKLLTDINLIGEKNS